ncbi:MAG: HNH endonuclease [Candidatus Aureabacteria bacterium]|nr:HNH endonuclease [Candidatus Auribacterota bacterium]
MINYQITPKGEKYINNPQRNHNSQIRTNYFENLILIYMIVKNERYQSSKFKKYVIKSLNILNNEDCKPMNRGNYSIWKHHIDAAKQGLLQRQGILTENRDGTFSISDKKINDAYNKISNYVEIIEQPKPEFMEEYPPEKTTTTITRSVRDTALSNKVKEDRNCQCQICGTRLSIEGKGYAETHHIKPLGHDGPDIKANMLVLCPNHHVLFDYGEIAIFPEDCEAVVDKEHNKIFTFIPPAPKKEYVEYHYNKIYKK